MAVVINSYPVHAVYIHIYGANETCAESLHFTQTSQNSLALP